jgi:monofunctional biosynthetic peptidoglycan transglycosylase
MRYRKYSAFILSVLAILGSVFYFWPEWITGYSMPEERLKFQELKPPSLRELKDHQGRVMLYLESGSEYRVIYKPLNRISRSLQDLVVFSEDAKFLSHGGFDVEEIKNSIEANLNEKRRLRGASTITQQLAKNLFLDKRRSFLRKLYEVPWTLALERDLTKAQILELYLNVIEWGPGIFGAEMASRHFFDKSASDLTFGESLYLTLIIPNPIQLDLFAHPKAEKAISDRRRSLLDRWITEKKLSGSEASEAIQADWTLVGPGIAERNFTPWHTGNYAASRDSKSLLRDFLKDNLCQIYSERELSQRNLTLTFSFSLLKEIFRQQLVASNEEGPWVAIYEGEAIRALRNIGKNKSLELEFSIELEKRGYHIKRLETPPWKTLKVL